MFPNGLNHYSYASFRNLMNYHSSNVPMAEARIIDNNANNANNTTQKMNKNTNVNIKTQM